MNFGCPSDLGPCLVRCVNHIIWYHRYVLNFLLEEGWFTAGSTNSLMSLSNRSLLFTIHLPCSHGWFTGKERLETSVTKTWTFLFSLLAINRTLCYPMILITHRITISYTTLLARSSDLFLAFSMTVSIMHGNDDIYVCKRDLRD